MAHGEWALWLLAPCREIVDPTVPGFDSEVTGHVNMVGIASD